MGMLSDFELGWIVAFLEGEGSFLPQPSAAVTAGQAQRWPLERLQLLLGGRIYPHTTHATPMNYWRLTGDSAAGLMMTVYSRMSPRRQGQIRRALVLWRAAPGKWAQRRHCYRGHPFEDGSFRVSRRKNGR